MKSSPCRATGTRLGDDGEGDDAAELQPRDRDDRHERVLERVPEVDGAVRQPARAGELDVVGRSTSSISTARAA